MDLISIIIITYKRPITILQRAINSAISQDYGNIEIIVVNDCPEDIEGSRKIEELIQSYEDERILLKHHIVNSGANAARNTGFKMSKGKYVSFLDDDDEWYSNKISKQYTAISKDDKYGIAYSGFVRISEDDKIPCYPIRVNKKDSCVEKILKNNFVGPTSFTLVSAAALKEVGGFDEDILICQEYELWIRILEKYDAVCVDELLGNYYYSDDSTFKVTDKYINGCDFLFSKHRTLYKKFPLAKSDKLLNMFAFSCKRRRWKKAVCYKMQAFIVCPLNINNFTILLLIKKLYIRMKDRRK